MIVQDFHKDEYMEYQEERALHCLHARADIPSGVQKYPKTLNRVNYDLGRVGKLWGEGLLFLGYWHGEGLLFLGY